jgi:hypothetical protein
MGEFTLAARGGVPTFIGGRASSDRTGLQVGEAVATKLWAARESGTRRGRDVVAWLQICMNRPPIRQQAMEIDRCCRQTKGFEPRPVQGERRARPTLRRTQPLNFSPNVRPRFETWSILPRVLAKTSKRRAPFHQL